MDKVLNDFIHALRGAEVRVSTSEALDAARVVQCLGYADRTTLEHALAATLAKSLQEKDAFHDTFTRFFAAQELLPVENSAEDPAAQTSASPDESSADANANPTAMAAPQSQLGQMLLRGDTGAMQAAMGAAADAARIADIRMITQRGLFGRRMMMAMGLGELENELWQALESPDPAQQALGKALQEAREQLRQQARAWVERQFVLQAAADQRQLREETLMSLSLQHLREFRQVRPLVQKMAKKLVSLHSRRRREAVRGRLDFRKTLRHSIPHDGSILTLHWKTRKIDRPKVMVICDVSGSVSAAARFLLMFLYSMVEVIPRVRAFAFSSALGEVTSTFDSEPLEKAIGQTLDTWGNGSTDYHRALNDFMLLAGNDIDRRTTVIMLGDARNNYGDPNLPVWQAICRRAGRTYWLNPEARNRWGSGDSDMQRYLPWLSQASECQNLRQLERFAATLLKVST